MPRTYPINLLVAGRKCVVVGGGPVAARKAESLAEAGAKVLVVAPEIGPDMDRLAREKTVEVQVKTFDAVDLAGAMLVVAATDSQEVNQAVFNAARSAGVLANVVDQPEMCDFYVPSVITRGDLVFTISTGGAGPGVSKKIRQEFEAKIGDEYEILLLIVAECRDGIRKKYPADTAARTEAMRRILDLDLVTMIREGRVQQARTEALSCI